MKNLIQKVTIYGVILVGLTMACDNSLKSTYEEFAEDGETIYIGRADTVLLGHGFNKLRFGIVINADPKISKGVVKTNNEDIYHEFDVVRTSNGKDTTTFDLDIPEGEYTLGVFLMDANDNSSIRREVSAKVYGESYQNGLINREVLSVEASADTAWINWGQTLPGIVYTLLTYEDGAGEEQTIEVSNEETQTEIPSYKQGGNIHVSSAYEPTPTAIEVFEATPSEMSFP